MATRPNLMTPRMEELLERVDSKFTLVTLSAMRAREINDYYNQLGEGLGKIVPPQVTSVSRKPLSIAMEEIEGGKIEALALTPDEKRASDAAVGDASGSKVDATGHGASRGYRDSLWKVRPGPARRSPRTQP